MESFDSQLIENIKLEPADLDSFASWKKENGHDIIYNEGIYWEKIFQGFYQPAHIVQKLSLEQIHYPQFLHWGVRGVLQDSESSLANGLIHFYAFEHIKKFDITVFSHQRRSNVRKCFRNVDIREVKDEKIMMDQGYDVISSSLQRTNHLEIPSKDEYLKHCTAYINNGDNSHIILGAFLENRLLAYLDICAVEETAYLMNMYIHSDALNFSVSPGLFYSAFLLCRESEKITQVLAGGPTPDDNGLEIFKKRMGFTIVDVPTFCKMNKMVALLLRMKCPESYHQLLSVHH